VTTLDADGRHKLQQWGTFAQEHRPLDIAKANAYHKNHGAPYLDAVIDQLHDRFASGEMIAALQIFSPSDAPSLDSDALGSYGDEDLQTILAFYANEAHAAVTTDSKGHPVPAIYAADDESLRERRSPPIVSKEDCTREWVGYRHMLAEQKEEDSRMSKYISKLPVADQPTTEFGRFLAWYLHSSYPEMFPCLTRLVHIVAALPVGSATVERSFSKLKLIKAQAGRLTPIRMDFGDCRL
jgi:hypothetical protein